MDLRGVKEAWDKSARENPVGSMLPTGVGNIADVEALYAFGQREIDDLIKYIGSLPIEIGRKKALDFGCGLGRSSQALSRHFDEVYGVDIAPSILTLAEKHNRYPGKCKYLLNETNDLRMFPDNTFDLIWCYGVLHVVEPQYFRSYIKEFLRIAAPGGLIVFHQASEPARTLEGWIMRVVPTRVWNIYRRRRYGFEVYGMKRQKVLDLIQEANGSLVAIKEERKTPGPNWTSFQYYVRA